ncbi:MAG TPA: PLP-dependent aspartate aminotransferase family protein [Phycisphaerales bacterium]|nr:PLP-dependent aspartate aminotransferase family protein [Phycisphaerales bacterium]
MHDTPNLRLATKVIHAGQHPEPVTGAVMPPIFTASTYAQESPGKHKGFEYSRSHNPTRYALERMVAKLEGSTIDESADPSCGGFAFASGLASMTTCLELIDAGAHVISMDDVYGGSNRLLSRVRERSQGLKVSYVDLSDPAKFAAAAHDKVSMVWVETPTNPTLKLVDLAAIAKIAREKCPEAILICDNTFASPINQRPLEHGFDIVMHSATKYLNGHSDIVAGLLVTSDLELCQRLRFHQNAVGAVLGPFDSYLCLRGIKTLALRMDRHNASGLRIAQWLEKHPAVERVVYPALPSHPHHSVYKRQMTGATGMITFFIKGGLDEARRFLETVRIFALAESLGGVESLVDHPAIMTHASVPPAMRAKLGITDNLIRLSVGIEDCDDLLDDLETALRAASPAGIRK